MTLRSRRRDGQASSEDYSDLCRERGGRYRAGVSRRGRGWEGDEEHHQEQG
ncbi:MAG: hypothetical protein M3O15_04340 [Acidobacteriota bacterium]|nr:hypothetical protein [Acidobacteriota bacterium]